MFFDTTVRVLLAAVYLVLVTSHAILFSRLVRSISGPLEACAAGMVFASLALWITFNKTATLLQKVVHETVLNLILAVAAFSSISETIANLARTSGTPEHCRWSDFFYFVRNGSLDLWCQFLVIWIVGRLLVWAMEQMNRQF